MKPKVVIISISQDEQPRPEFAAAVKVLAAPLVRFVSKRVHGLHPDPEKNSCMNIAHARNLAREQALKRDASHYLWLDDDIIPPPHTIGSLLSHTKLAIGGWFPLRSPLRSGALSAPVAPLLWSGGRWVGDNLFAPFMAPIKSVVKTDLLSMGCALLARDVLKSFEYAAGVNTICRTTDGRSCHLADSGDYSNKLLDAGIQPYLDGNVICRHLN